MNLQKMSFDFNSATGSSQPVLLAQIRDDMEYANGKPTGVRLGSKYIIACPANGFDKIVVKIAEPAPIMTQEELEGLNGAGQYIRVMFKGFTAKMRQDFTTKELAMSAVASAIEVMNLDKGGKQG